MKKTRQKLPLIEAIEPRLLLSAAVSSVVHPVADPHYINIHATTQKNKSRLALSGSSTPLGLTPAQVRGAYGIDNISFNGIAGDGTGQTIAIVDAYDDPSAAADLNAFSTFFGLPTFNAGGTSPTFTKNGVNSSTITTQTTLPKTDRDGPYSSTGGGDWEQEESLDIDWAHVIAPRANIILIEASSSSTTNLDNAVLAARKLAAVDVVSMSWDGTESSGETSQDADFTTPASHIGITFLAATGDDGSYTAGTTTTTTEYPAASPNVVAVGGTALTVSGSTYSSEVAWGSGTTSGQSTSSTLGGSGGGISLYESQPPYQTGIVTQSSTKRTYPDVSMNADPYTGVPIYDSWDFGVTTPWVPGEEGGTSLATPTWAGLIAIADQGRNLSGATSLDGATQTLPALYKLSPSDFHDITSGSNGNYSATTGYDLVTGLGTPVANTLVPDLAGQTQTTSIDNLYVKKDSNGTQLDEWINSATPGSGTPTLKAVLADASSILFNGATGNNTLTIDDSAGTLALGGTYNASSTGANSINFIGTTAADGLTLSAMGITPSGGFGTSPITLSNVQTLNFPGGSGGSDSINVTSSPTGGYTINADTPTGTPNISITLSGSSTAINFASTQHLAALTIGATDSATLTQSASPGGSALVVSSLSDSGSLDLTNNVMIIHNGNLASITALLSLGYNDADWNGTGIASSTAANDASKMTALGVLLNNTHGFTYYSTFDGQPVSASDVIVKYTLYGDANLDGVVDGDDYSSTDNGFNADLTGWQNGDFNYSSSIDADDYILLDNAFNSVQVLV